MQLFFSREITGGKVMLQDDEARHASGVLRKRPGDRLDITDGQGKLYHCTLQEVKKQECVCSIDSITEQPRRNLNLHIALAPTKNLDRTEWFVEKCTEMGIEKFSFIICEHSERKVLKTERLEKIMIAAAKQSLRFHFPELSEAIPFNDFIKKHQSDTRRFIATCEDQELSFGKDIKTIEGDITVLIGPEGDFSPTELTLAKQHGYKTLSLGTSRLRTETAGMVACAQINLIFEMS